MMNLVRDGEVRPDLFRWNGGIGEAALTDWLERHRLLGRLPRDLLSFWVQTGGGDVFETETILGPLGDPTLGEDITSVNRALRDQGMPERFLVFHTGLITSAVDTLSGEYVELSDSGFGVSRRFSSLDDWYAATLRKEYAVRYDLR